MAGKGFLVRLDLFNRRESLPAMKNFGKSKTTRNMYAAASVIEAQRNSEWRESEQKIFSKLEITISS